MDRGAWRATVSRELDTTEHTHTHTHTHTRAVNPRVRLHLRKHRNQGRMEITPPEDELAHTDRNAALSEGGRPALVPRCLLWFARLFLLPEEEWVFQGQSPWTLGEKKKKLFCLKGASHQWDPDHRCPRKEAEPWWRDYPMDGGRNLPPSFYVL